MAKRKTPTTPTARSVARPWFEIKALAGPDTAEVWIYDEIGDDWFGESTSAKQFVTELQAITARNIALHINSPGGSVFDGQAIYTALRNHPANVTTYVDGLAGSIASVIACAGDTVVVPANAMMMIHDPFGVAFGTASDMRSMADVYDKIGNTIIGVYAAKTCRPRDEIAAAMEAESWFDGPEAVAFGLADTVGEPLAAAASAASRFDLASLGFKHVPKALAITPKPRAAGRVLSQENEDVLVQANESIEAQIEAMEAATEALESASELIETVLAQVDPSYSDDDDDESEGGADGSDEGSAAAPSASSGDTKPTMTASRVAAMLHRRFEEV